MLSFVIATMFRLSPGLTASCWPLCRWSCWSQYSSAGPLHRATGASEWQSRRLTPICRNMLPASLFSSYLIGKSEARSEFEKINRAHMEAFKDSIFAYGWFYPVVEFLGCRRSLACWPMAAFASVREQ